MTEKDEKNEKNEPQIAVTAEPVASAGAPQQGGPPIPPGHSRYYCSKCHAVSSCMLGAWSARKNEPKHRGRRITTTLQLLGLDC